MMQEKDPSPGGSENPTIDFVDKDVVQNEKLMNTRCHEASSHPPCHVPPYTVTYDTASIYYYALRALCQFMYSTTTTYHEYATTNVA